MALTVAVEPNVKNVVLNWTAPANTTRVTFTRVGPSGTPAGVRGFTDADTSPGAIVARDFEAPLGLPLTYTAEAFDSTDAVIATDTATITIPSAGCADLWLNDLARVNNTLRVTIESLPELAYDALTTAHEILARRDPIITSDVAHTPSFDLSFITDTLTQRDQARDALGNGVPVLLRTPPEYGIGNLYFGVIDFKEQRIVTEGTMPARIFAVSGRQVQRPDPSLFIPLGVATYAHVLETFATYADLMAQRVSYDAVLYDWAGSEPSDIVPWLPADV